MHYKHDLIFYRTITPLHVGCGQDVGVVDMPVIRERTTGYPYIPGSGIRGSLRNYFEIKNKDATNASGTTQRLFGPERAGAVDFAGCLAVHDARILLFPVRSDRHIYLWGTCPQVLERLRRDVSAFTLGFPVDSIPTIQIADEGSYVGKQSGELHLEEFAFKSQEESSALLEFGKVVLGNEQAAARVICISNSAFYHFVNHATMLVQHNALNSAKTVVDGQLFSIESVPPDAVFYGLIGATKERFAKSDDDKIARWEDENESLKAFVNVAFENDERYLHFGGRESTGEGVTQLRRLSDSGVPA